MTTDTILFDYGNLMMMNGDRIKVNEYPMSKRFQGITVNMKSWMMMMHAVTLGS